MTKPPDATPPAHDYAAALSDFTGRRTTWLRDDYCKYFEAITHALTAMQSITAALPAGVDPVKLVRGLAEPSVEAGSAGVEADRKSMDQANEWYNKTKSTEFHVHNILRAEDTFKAMIAQLYREASEVDV